MPRPVTESAITDDRSAPAARELTPSGGSTDGNGGTLGSYQPYGAIAKHWLLVVTLVVVGAVVVAGGSAARTASYSSTSTVAWNPNFRADLPALSAAPSSGAQPTLDVPSAAIWVKGDVVMGAASSVAGVGLTDLRDATTVSASAPNDTITITVTGPSVEDAQKRAGAVTNGFVSQSRRQVLESLQAQAKQVFLALLAVSKELTPSETADLRNKQALLAAAATSAAGPASVVQKASKPVDTRGTLSRNAAIGGALGLVLGVLGALGLGARTRRRHAAV